MTTTATSATSATTEQWWKRAVVYQVYPRSFADSNGDGIGDLPGVISKLDYLAELGVDVLWLSPFYPSPQDDNGYDVSDYTGVDPLFGTLGDFDTLVTAAHSRGMKVIIDIVANHTSDEHPWFVEALQGKDSAKRDWYIWRPPRAGTTGGEPGAEPNNWGSFFSGPAWEYDAASGEYYLHLFSRKQPDLNWDNPQVRAAIAQILRWWLARGVDGFRFDVVNFVSKDPALPDGPVPPGLRYGDGAPFYSSGPRIHEYLAELIQRITAGHTGRLLTVGEMPGVTVDQARLYTDPDRHELDMVFQFEHVGLDHGTHKFDPRPIDLRDLKASFARWQDALSDRGWNSLYWNNHDQPRIVSRFGDDRAYRVQSATMLATILHLQRGTPFVYQGEELGMTNTDFHSRSDFRDIESLNFYDEQVAAGVDPETVLAGLRRVSRDNSRTPMPWTAGRNGGFSDATPWIAPTSRAAQVNAADARADQGSVWHYYRRLIQLRHTDDVVVHGDFRMLVPDDRWIVAFTRSLPGRSLLVVGNFSGESRELPAELTSRRPKALVIGNYPAPADELDPLRPWEARVVEVAEQ